MTKLGMNIVADIQREFGALDVIVLATGFEDRAFHVLDNYPSNKWTHLILIPFDNDIPGNTDIAKKFQQRAAEKFDRDRIHVVYLREARIRDFTREFVEVIRSLPLNLCKIGIDISGMPSYMIFAVLNAVRDNRRYETQKIIYTSAREYTPTESDYESLKARQGDDIEYMPSGMALEMSDNLIFEPFSGYRSGGTKSCLALFAGYEAHRSTGVIDAINPTILLLIYGHPRDKSLAWREDLSKRLHRKFERTRRCATEVVPTWDVNACVAKLEEYYNFLIDDYDLTVAPVCSKMETVASYLFWERYPEVQITFPLPIGYDPERRPKGVGATYCLDVPGKLSFWWSGKGQAETEVPRNGESRYGESRSGVD
jgi:hypothetical protein